MKKISENEREESKDCETNPFLAAKSLLIDSGATPIFKQPQIKSHKNEGKHWSEFLIPSLTEGDSPLGKFRVRNVLIN